VHPADDVFVGIDGGVGADFFDDADRLVVL
jgi:hypothetical protein